MYVWGVRNLVSRRPYFASDKFAQQSDAPGLPTAPMHSLVHLYIALSCLSRRGISLLDTTERDPQHADPSPAQRPNLAAIVCKPRDPPSQ